MLMRESVLDRESNLKHEKKKLHKKLQQRVMKNVN